MKIQFAIDCPLGMGINIAKKVEPYLDIIEIGDNALRISTLSSISLLREIFPDKKILADLKIMDGGYGGSKYAFGLGADIVTTCLATDPDICMDSVRAAKEMGKESWLDLIGIDPENYHKYVDFVNKSGADYVCPHLWGGRYNGEAGKQFRKDSIKMVGKLGFQCKVVLSGGLTLDYLEEIKECNPHHVNLGGALIRAEDPVAVAKAFYEA